MGFNFDSTSDYLLLLECMFLSLSLQPSSSYTGFVCFYLWLHDPSSSNTQIVEYTNLCVSIFDFTTLVRRIPKSSDTQIYVFLSLISRLQLAEYPNMCVSIFDYYTHVGIILFLCLYVSIIDFPNRARLLLCLFVLFFDCPNPNSSNAES